MSSLSITAIILTKNEQTMVVNCIETLRWCKEIIVIDSQSTDSTVQLAKRAGAVVYSTGQDAFDKRRNYALSKVRTDWVFYIDADERVTPELKAEIVRVIAERSETALTLQRKNIHYGEWLRYGGWDKDFVTRIFKTENLRGWKGKIHESAVYTGENYILNQPLIHLTHRNMVDGLYKTIAWTGYEAELLFEAGQPQVTPTVLLRKTVMEFVRRAFQWNGRRDGIQGWIEAMVQAMNRFIVYERLWELQQKPHLEEKYQILDQKIIDSWKDEVS